MNEIIKQEQAIAQMGEKGLTEMVGAKNIEAYQKLLNLQPPKAWTETHPTVKNHLYIPISRVEMILDEMFFGLWKTTNFRTKTIANEIVGEIELSVFHPILREWITRIGAAAVQIQYKAADWVDGKKVKRNNLPSDIDAKILNTLVKDYPHLKTECIKNASKGFGRRFGRDLNREKVSGDYYPITEQLSVIETEEVEQQFATASTENELRTLWSNNKHWHGNTQIADLFFQRYQQVTK